MTTFLNQMRALLSQSLKVEWATPERWLSPLLFAITVLVLFSFAVGQLEGPEVAHLLVAETFLTAFFSLQISFSRSLDPDMQDRVFDVLRTYPISSSAWFLGKYLLVLVMGTLILIPTMILSSFFYAKSGVSLVDWSLIGVALTALAGMSALGVLLSTMTMRSGSKQILYPLLYFPLTTPVLLSAVESSKAILIKNESLDMLLSSWLGLLIIFGIIYFTLGLLLFGELVKAE
ncbi:heme exporter protein CcmB [Pseudobacteriovorax antillogorgiicola]|uniref:ABC-type transport system involved in cytochrome c biogenesis, permease component n=1 Tax=Pseudobacteriovorax antillogorgiicola TaxID=1513793 RepID=A0A1Y6C252_9BACT|nr:heme exporter protein CcmB [Pseudobacteriovorax antillogorgiicola]TCS52349.1 ABC-type transport system involved in cytochrome c biogenesis permease component [Pseudobacteriovorax antillogorgiicola]SMF29614.1 ABC-type transport system involved in cytochrome c biogenesis, permease component [Pseudobacteriovorax antillogorgiicola]